jgi:hypothetical protein
MPKLQSFHADKELKREVYDLITAVAKERLIEDATKELPTVWFKRLMEVLNDTERELDSMFEQKKETKKVNHAR